MSDPLAKIKKKLQDEIDQLSHELSVELPKEIAVARAHGDLSENAEYKYAKERQRYVKIDYKLVSSEEADAEKGLISTTSPIGKALLNRKVGDEIEVATPAGKKEFEIVRLVTIHDGE